MTETTIVVTFHDTGPGSRNYYKLTYPDGTVMIGTSVRDINYKTGVRVPDVRAACRAAREDGVGYFHKKDGL